MKQEPELAWTFSNFPFADIGFAFSQTISQLAHEQMPDIADMFPLTNSWELQGHFDNGWVAVRIKNRYGSGASVGGEMPKGDLDELTKRILPFATRSHKELSELLGSAWFSFDCFTYVGPCSGLVACWPDANQHLVDWLNAIVVPEILKRNQNRVLRAIPQPPQFKLDAVQDALWILECEQTVGQGTAFNLSGVGLVTCQHVLGTATHAFRANEYSRKYPVRLRASNPVIDLAILDIDAPLGEGLPVGCADQLNQMDHLAVFGFPNYRTGDSGVIVPGIVTGFRMVSGIRRVLTNAPIIAGNSGGPVLDSSQHVIGIAVTGADRMEEAQQTENHGIIPVEALGFLHA